MTVDRDYVVYIVCGNCGHRNKREIPKGTRVRYYVEQIAFAHVLQCDLCKCNFTLENMPLSKVRFPE
jgi:hypothetical protein